MLMKRTFSGAALALVAAFAFGGSAFAAGDDVAYAGKLWKALEDARLVGKDAIHTVPFEGTAPHGAMLETLDGTVKVGSHEGTVIVKRNYGPEGIKKEQVANERGKHLKAVTVMFRREKGYDPEDKDWFWVKYMPDGSVLKNPAGMALAGMVGKGADAGCIACHMGAPGGDLVFGNDVFAKY